MTVALSSLLSLRTSISHHVQPYVHHGYANLTSHPIPMHNGFQQALHIYGKTPDHVTVFRRRWPVTRLYFVTPLRRGWGGWQITEQLDYWLLGYPSITKIEASLSKGFFWNFWWRALLKAMAFTECFGFWFNWMLASRNRTGEKSII